MPRKNEPVIRSCIVTREAMPIDRLIRFVLDPEGRVVPDLRRRLPGRGVWVTASRAMLATAEKKRLFNRAFKAEVMVEPGLPERLDRLLEDAAIQALSLAQKAGEIVTGFAKVEASIGREPIAAVIRAREAAEDGGAKIEAALRRRFGRSNEIPIIGIYRSEQLDLALGRSNVIHAALLAGRASENVLERVAALARFRGEDGLSGIGEDLFVNEDLSASDDLFVSDDVGETAAPEKRETMAPETAEDPAGQKTTE